MVGILEGVMYEILRRWVGVLYSFIIYCIRLLVISVLDEGVIYVVVRSIIGYEFIMII